MKLAYTQVLQQSPVLARKSPLFGANANAQPNPLEKPEAKDTVETTKPIEQAAAAEQTPTVTPPKQEKKQNLFIRILISPWTFLVWLKNLIFSKKSTETTPPKTTTTETTLEKVLDTEKLEKARQELADNTINLNEKLETVLNSEAFSTAMTKEFPNVNNFKDILTRDDLCRSMPAPSNVSNRKSYEDFLIKLGDPNYIAAFKEPLSPEAIKDLSAEPAKYQESLVNLEEINKGLKELLAIPDPKLAEHLVGILAASAARIAAPINKAGEQNMEALHGQGYLSEASLLTEILPALEGRLENWSQAIMELDKHRQPIQSDIWGESTPHALLVKRVAQLVREQAGTLNPESIIKQSFFVGNQEERYKFLNQSLPAMFSYPLTHSPDAPNSEDFDRADQQILSLFKQAVDEINKGIYPPPTSQPTDNQQTNNSAPSPQETAQVVTVQESENNPTTNDVPPPILTRDETDAVALVPETTDQPTAPEVGKNASDQTSS